jgi:tRNA-Thr(GGU) m(6)t(6)A37 methyltransferase TsaA
MKMVLTPLLMVVIVFAGGCAHMSRVSQRQETEETFTLYPIGKVEKEEGRTSIVIDKQYLPALKGVDNLSHITVVYWFDRNDTPEKRGIMQVHPRGNKNKPKRGVFATHAPVRPNLIAISRCKILSVNENIIEVEEIDAFDDSPVLDLKS